MQAMGTALNDVFSYWRDPLGLFMRGMGQRTEAVRYRLGPYHAVQANRSEHIEHVLIKNQRNYVKGATYDPLRVTLGQGLVTSQGDLWRRQRKLVQPAFHARSLETFAAKMSLATEDFVGELAAQQGDAIDIHEAMVRLTFRIVGLTLFSRELAESSRSFGAALNEVLDWTNRRTDAPLRLPTWLPTPGNRRYFRAKKVLDDLIYALIDERRRSGHTHGDLLDMLLHGGDGEMSNAQLRDELLTMAAAGHETTANALSWTWYLLSRHPDVARRVAQEVDDVLGDRTPTLADIGQLRFTERVVSESMRLFPPVWAFDRQAVGADMIGDQPVREGSLVIIVPYSIHRDPMYWSNPEGFDPDRFLPERASRRPRFAYMPFGGGARICIGKAFAMMEAKIVVALIARRWRLELVPGHPVVPEPSVTLRPRHGVQVRVRPRG